MKSRARSASPAVGAAYGQNLMAADNRVLRTPQDGRLVPRHATLHDNEITTYLDPASRPYELDHVFTDAETHDQLAGAGCHAVDDATVAGLSDHAPLVVQIAICTP